MADHIGTATYSPDDNKLRIYPFARLPKDVYDRVKAAGFSWAPKQELFVAGMWTPERADLLVELCGEIEDDDRSLVDRAEEREARFEDYREARTEDYHAAHAAVKAIADHIPLGQPILVGHHSERRARKDAERIENGMRKAVKLWETAEYWQSRAAGALRHAKYKERPDVRARRIKTIEADRRRMEREKARVSDAVKLFALVDQPEKFKPREDGQPWTREARAYYLAGRMSGGPYMAIVDGHLRYSAYDVLAPDDKRYKACPAMTVDEVLAKLGRWETEVHARADRWIAHCDLRLAYERAMLGEAGGTATDRTGPAVGGAVRCWASPRGGWSYVQKVNKVSVTVLDNWGNGRDHFTRTIEFDKLHAVMSKAEVAQAKAEGRLVESAPDSKGRIEGFLLRELPAPPAPPEKEIEIDTTAVEAMKATLKAGVQVVSVPTLFETPREVARRVVELAYIRPGHKVLEPSAGTGILAEAVRAAVPDAELQLIEINHGLAERLSQRFTAPHEPICRSVLQGDFLELSPAQLGRFDRIVMNPPFDHGSDIRHIQHARAMLAPEGRLVAICAAGPKQEAALVPEAESWEYLPAGTFAGTGVRAAIVVLGPNPRSRG